MVYSIFWMMLGTVFYSYLIDNLGIIIRELNKELALFDSKTDHFNKFSDSYYLPEFLQDGIQDSLTIDYKLNNFYNSNFQKFQKKLPVEIYNEILISATIEIIQQVKIFQIDLLFSAHIISKCNILRFLSNQIIYFKNDEPDELFFIVDGNVSYYNQHL
jgi:hypothetical protein